MIFFSCVNVLLQNLKTTKIQTDPKLKQQYEKDAEKETADNFEKETQYTIKPIRKNSTVFLIKTN